MAGGQSRCTPVAALGLLLGLSCTPVGAGRAEEGTGTGVGLPRAILEVIEEYFPGATISEVDAEHEGGLELHELEIAQNGQELESLPLRRARSRRSRAKWTWAASPTP